MCDYRVKPLFLGNSNAFLLACGNDVALIDAGLGNRSKTIIAEASKLVKNFTGLKYIFVTHAHYDHVGSVFELKKKFDSLLVAHELEADNLARGMSPVPSGTMWLSRQVSWLGCLLFRHCIKFKGVMPDVVFADRKKLPFGNAFIECLHTPGHTEGSISIKFADVIFSGDTFFHLLPHKIFPPFANDVNLLLDSWKTILSEGVYKIYPGHGKPFSRHLLKENLKKYVP